MRLFKLLRGDFSDRIGNYNPGDLVKSAKDLVKVWGENKFQEVLQAVKEEVEDQIVEVVTKKRGRKPKEKEVVEDPDPEVEQEDTPEDNEE